MTLLPGAPLAVRGHPGNEYDVNEVCAHPACFRPAVHCHHVWSRSHLRGQPYEWVRFSDGTVIGNRLGFCAPHHEMLTGEIGGYRARLIWDSGLYWWEDRISDELTILRWDSPSGWSRLNPLTDQPPVAGEKHTHEHMTEGEQCPTCGHVKTKPREVAKPGKLRPTKEWSVAVPDDAEIGAQVLDDWIEDFAIVFGMDHYTSRLKRYHVLSLLMGATQALRKDIIEMVAEAAGRRLGA